MHSNERLGAEAALGLVGDPLDAQVGGGLAISRRYGERIADFGALVEPKTADIR